MQQNNNKENRSFKIITAIALCVAVLCLSVAYATLSAQLKVSGTAKVEVANWDVHLEKDGTGYDTEGTGATVNSYTVNGQTASNIQIGLKYPGDKAIIKLKAKNTGDIPAVLNNVTKASVSCTTEEPDDSTARDLICGTAGDLTNSSNITYKVLYGGQDVTAGGTANIDSVKELAATSGEKDISIELSYNKDIDALPTKAVTITLTDLTFSYEQDTSVE